MSVTIIPRDRGLMVAFGQALRDAFREMGISTKIKVPEIAENLAWSVKHDTKTRPDWKRISMTWAATGKAKAVNTTVNRMSDGSLEFVVQF